MDRITAGSGGYRMPAEWEPHEGTWIAWPHEETDWPGKFEAVPWVYCEFVRQLSRVERVHILVSDESRTRDMLIKSGSRMDAVDLIPCRTDRSWARDYCPIFVRDSAGRMLMTDWRFNGWARYDNWEHDDAVPSYLAQRLGMHALRPEHNGRRVVLEGGSIDVNGRGLLLTTEECLLSPIQQRNPRFSREDYEAIFAHWLGISETIWLHHGIAGDDTHGHIDDLARFVDTETVALAVERDPSEINYEPLQENLRLLRAQPLRVVELPMPEPVCFDGQRLPASYANFYIANDAVLVPTFNDPNDRLALNTLAEVFPGRKVIGIGSADLVLGLGTLHCMTQQQPA
ncbi:MAG TPA: agmatine deiminase family protein [Bryobacteraceae bacterium]|nr:agmatine deiminase family protein [Bryobacteraceae bacterium]